MKILEEITHKPLKRCWRRKLEFKFNWGRMSKRLMIRMKKRMKRMLVEIIIMIMKRKKMIR